MGNFRVSLRSSRSLTQKKNIRVSSLHVDLNQLFLQALENPKNLLDSVQLFQLFTFPYCIVGPTSMYIYTQVQCVLLIVFNNKNQGFSLFSLFTWYQSLGRKKPFSDRVSFRSPSPSSKAFWSTVSLSENPHRRQKTLTASDFPAKSFSDTDHTIKCARRRSSILC